MRLYLSSSELGNHPERLVSLAGARSRAAVIMNALDNFPHERERWFAGQKEALQNLGFIVGELDLREYFGAPGELARALDDKGLMWINGGNTFLLRRAMSRSGFDAIVRQLLGADRLVYAGFSAGVCCAAPSLHGIEFLDDPHALAEGYSPEPIWQGLGLIDYHIAVHYRPGDPEVEPIQRTVRYFREHGMRYVALRDGEVLVQEAGNTELVGA
jgi:dipeptidase E